MTDQNPVIAHDPSATLSVRDLKVTFPSEAGAVSAVRGVNFDVHPGEVVGIVGESGSGKSTVALAVMGLLQNSARVTGSAHFKGDELLGLDDKALSRIRGRSVAMVFQDPLSAFTPVYTIGAQISEAIRIHQNVSKDQANARAIELLDLVGIPQAKDRIRSFPHEFSGGMRQRAMIAMAIANDPDLIIADEPTTALDVTVQAQILDVLETARQATKAALLLITHDLGVVAGTCDRVAVMYGGRIVETSEVYSVFKQPQMPYTIGLLGAVPRLDAGVGEPLVPIEGAPPNMVNLPDACPFVERCPIAIDVCREREPGLDETLTSTTENVHQVACHRSNEIVDGRIDGQPVFALPVLGAIEHTTIARADREVVIDVKDLIRQYPVRKGAVLSRRVGTVYAVDGVSFDVRTGEALALVGESGCGKTSTVTEILELRKLKGGSVTIFGKNAAELSKDEKQEVRRNLQVVFQDPQASLDPRLPVGDILAEPLKTHGMPKEEQRARVLELLSLVGLEATHADRYPAEFSGGQRQRIAIARALALNPQLIILDEPVSALDVSIQAGVLNLLTELRARLGLAYIFVAHDLSVVRQTADRVAVMYLGRIIEIGDTDDVFNRPWHPYTQALLSAVPIPDPVRERARHRILLTGDQPSPTVHYEGCRFRSRCFRYQALPEDQTQDCRTLDPSLTDPTGHNLGHEGTHGAACFHIEERDVV